MMDGRIVPGEGPDLVTISNLGDEHTFTLDGDYRSVKVINSKVAVHGDVAKGEVENNGSLTVNGNLGRVVVAKGCSVNVSGELGSRSGQGNITEFVHRGTEVITAQLLNAS